MNYLIVKEHHRKGDFEIRKGKHGSIHVVTSSSPVIGYISSEKPESDFNFYLDCYKDNKVIGHCIFDFSMIKDDKLIMKKLPIKGSPDNSYIIFKICWITPYKSNLILKNMNYDLQNEKNSFDTSILQIPRKVTYPKWFTIGHRGSGSNKVSKEFLENTIVSCKTAADRGAEFVEFDIQMTNDGVPVIYHDFHIESEKVVGSINEPADVSEKGNYLYAVQQFKKDDFIKTGMNTSYQMERATFNDFLTKLPLNLGFDIEIKYPCFKKLNHSIPYFEMNKFVDTILDEMVQNAGDREIFFSSFDPLIVTMLRLKQKRWPVLQLFEKTRKESLEEMSSKVRSYAALFKVLNDDGFEGFVGDANHVLQQPQLVKEIIDMGYIFCTYGDPNNTYEGIEKQLQLGIRGICSDNMSLCRSVIDEYCRIHD